MSVQRLIDANALKEQIDYYIKEAGWSEHDNRVLGWCKEFIDNAPTVEISGLPKIHYDRGFIAGYEKGKADRPQGEWISRSALIKAIENEQIQWNRNTESDCARWEECESIMALINRIPTAEEKEK